jgi:hypothetical protein
VRGVIVHCGAYGCESVASVAVNSPAAHAKSRIAPTLALPVPRPADASVTGLDLTLAQMREYRSSK